jgi:hypothetical protein
VVLAITAVVNGATPELSISAHLTNGGFESGATGWDLAPQASIDTTTSNSHGGHSSLRLDATGPWQGSTQAVLLNAGQPYAFIGWGRSTRNEGHFSIFSYAPNGALVGSPFDRIFAATGHWEKVTAVFVAPTGAVQARLFLQNAGPGTYWFDDIALTPTDNTISNPGFENGGDSWSLNPHSTIESSNGDSHTGTHSLRLDADDQWQESFQSITVIGSRPYSFSGWGRSTSQAGHMSLITFDSSGVRIGSFDRVFGGGSTWQYVSGVYITPPTAIRVEVALQSSAAGTFWFDDVRLAPTANVIDNGGFESGTTSWRLGPHASIITSAQSHGGANFLQLLTDGPWEGSSQSPPIVEGETYTVKGWGRSTVDGGHATIISFDADGHEIGSRLDLTFPGTGTWVLFTGLYKPPANTARIDFWLQNAEPGDFAFDDVTITWA